MPRSIVVAFVFTVLAVAPGSARAQRFFRAPIVDPPSQEVTTEFLVNESGGVELLADRSPAAAAKGEEKAANPGEPGAKADPAAPKPARGPTAVVTLYRYFDDITVFSTIDLGTGKVVDVQAAQHLRTPLSDAEFEEAQALAREHDQDVQRLFERFGRQVTAYPQFSQFTLEGDPRIHRVVHLTYRVGKRELSYPRPQVDLTIRTVETPAPEVEPKAKVRPPRGD